MSTGNNLTKENCWHCGKPLPEDYTIPRHWPHRFGAAVLHKECVAPYRTVALNNPEAGAGHAPIYDNKSAADLLQECAKLYRERNAVYKDNYKHIGPVMAGFFPDGLTLRTAEDFIRFHLFMLALVKMTRYTNNWKIGHHDSLLDTSVYMAMLAMVDEEYLGKEKGNGRPFTISQVEEIARKEKCNFPINPADVFREATSELKAEAVDHVDCPCWSTGKFVQVPCPHHDGRDNYPLGAYHRMLMWIKEHPVVEK